MKKLLVFSVVFLIIVLALQEVQSIGAQGPIPLGAQVGTPWQGAPGVTESVAQIMARERRSPQTPVSPSLLRPRRTLPNVPRGANPSSNPFSALAPQSSPQSGFPLVPSSPQPIGTSFLGVQLSDSGFIPPDSMGGVSPTQVLVVVNGRIRVFDKTGVVGGLDASLDNFFASLSPTPFPNGPGDPNVRYDRLSGRWFVSALDFGTAPNRIFIAVSSSSTISSGSSFTFFKFVQDQVGGGTADNGLDADYDSLGVDAHSLYIGVNMFNSSSFVSTTGFVVNKSNLLTGTLTVTAFRSLGVSGSNGPFSPRGVQNDDPAATEGYFIGSDISSLNVLTLRRVTYSGGTPSISANIFVSLPSTYYPMFGVPSLGSSHSLDDIDNRLFAAQVHQNKITGIDSLWTAHNIRVDSSGVSSSSGTRDASRWYEVRNLTTTPTLYQYGTLFDSAASNPQFYWMPSIAMSGQGHAALGTSVSSAATYAGIAVAGRWSSDPLNTLQSVTSAQSGANSYNVGLQGCCYRWGDYSQTVVDPNDDMTMWTFQEYANALNSWGVRVIQLPAPPPAFPYVAAPSTVSTGLPSVTVVITGASLSGSGFFDPGSDSGGPGYSNHITAALSGGVVVNSISFNSPTRLTLNISTVSASAGGAHLTVTNPDAQKSTAYCILNVSDGVTVTPPCKFILPVISK